LRNHECRCYDRLATGTQWKLTGGDGDHWIQVPWKLCTNNAEVLRDAALADRGIALLPTFIAGNELREGRLRSSMTDYRAPELPVFALYPPTRYVSVKVRVFIDFLVARFAGRPSWEIPAATEQQI
jgi:DNA-binding transcriptional LysR family regulator